MPALIKSKPKKIRVGYIPDELVAKALVLSEGLQYHAAERLGLSPGTLSQRIKGSPYLQEVVAAAVEKRVDDAEKTMSTLVKEKCFNAACFTLKTKGKSRGYTEGTAIMVSNEMAAGLTAMLNQLAAAQNALKIANSLPINTE